MDEIFRSGTLEMSSTPLEAVVEPSLWTDVLTNRILVVVSMLLIMQHLLDLFRLTPPCSTATAAPAVRRRWSRAWAWSASAT